MASQLCFGYGDRCLRDVFAVLVVPKAMYYPVQALRNYDYCRNIRNVLDEIPEEAPVAAGTFTPPIFPNEKSCMICMLFPRTSFGKRYVVLGAYDADNFQKFAVKTRNRTLLVFALRRTCGIRYMVWASPLPMIIKNL